MRKFTCSSSSCFFVFSKFTMFSCQRILNRIIFSLHEDTDSVAKVCKYSKSYTANRLQLHATPDRSVAFRSCCENKLASLLKSLNDELSTSILSFF